MLADIGGTNTRCALVGTDNAPRKIQVFKNRSFANLTELLAHYIKSQPPDCRPVSGKFAVAAPIRADSIQMVNIDWQFSTESLRRSLRLEQLQLFNDFEALAIGLPNLTPDDIRQVGGGNAAPNQPKAVLGPGTGLGVASLISTQDGWQAISGEGGHVTLPAVTPQEAELIKELYERFGHCSAERLISGPGLELLHMTLHKSKAIKAARIAAQAEDGDEQAGATFNIFFELLGTIAADLALTMGALGGVYIGGGIIPRHAELFAASGFRRRFETKGRYGDYLESIPTYLIVSEHPTLAGLAAATSG
ncbi:MAG: glucokinase [Gammaproteobacteria bacterium]|jgi:glucokinase|nr:glucokinase [Gammaproteobacteria bacterium]MDP7295938.1 glucokinase [Gammaproteobacteria bacterium]MDP7419287.1 glucokinase [Gammaproteobacteria bacterium]HJP37530.1 glucokinase [Gammaproteobacteria bacterium]